MTDLDEPFEPFKTPASMTTASGQELFQVELPSGALIGVPTEEEAAHLTLTVERYQDQYALENVSDLAEVDRCLCLELQMHRNQVWLARRSDYDGKAVDENALQQRSKESSAEIRQIKKTLGIDKVARDRQTGRGSTHQYISDLLGRARRFGLMRNQQAAKSIELAMELISLVTVHRNANEKERRMLRCTEDDIIEWIETVFTPEFMAIDEYFREHDQSTYILSES